jgi:hypothetical protein
LLKGRAFWREWEIESFKLTGKIGAELADRFAEGCRFFRHSAFGIAGRPSLANVI